MLRETTVKDPEKFLDELLEQARKTYVLAQLVHCDLSEYNVLVHRGKGYLIDVGQAITSDHPNAHEYLRKDIGNLLHYFKKLGVERDAEECLRTVRGD